MFLKATITTFGCDDLTLSETGQSLGALEVAAGILLIGGAMHFLFLSPHVFIGRNQNLCIGRRIGQNRKCEHEIICLIWTYLGTYSVDDLMVCGSDNFDHNALSTSPTIASLSIRCVLKHSILTDRSSAWIVPSSERF